MIRFKESYSVFQTTLAFLKSRKNFNLTKDFLSSMFLRLLGKKVVKSLPSDKVSAGEIPIKTLQERIFCFPELTNCANKSLANN